MSVAEFAPAQGETPERMAEASRYLLRRSDVPIGPLRLLDRLVPLLRPLDGVSLPFGLSLWAVARPA